MVDHLEILLLGTADLAGKNDGKSFYIYGYKQAKIPVKKKK